jgi:HK97 family phage portal protein
MSLWSRLFTRAEAAPRAEPMLEASGDSAGVTLKSDTSTASRPAPWLLQAVGGGASASGVRVTEDTALSSMAVLACVNMIADTLAVLPFGVFAREDQGRTRERDHPVDVLLSSEPNGYQTAFEFKRLLVTQLCLRGNAYAWAERDRAGRVLAFRPVHPDLMTVKRATDGTPVYEFELWPGDGRQACTREDMIHAKWMSTNGYTGKSPIKVGAEAIGVTLATQEHGARYFQNGSKASGVLMADGNLDPDRARKVKDDWQQNMSGVKNAGAVAVLPTGVKFQQLTITNEDAQYLAARMFQNKDIGRLYKLPPFLIFETEGSTSWGTGLEQQMLAFLMLCLQPYITCIEQQFDRFVRLPRSNRDLYTRMNAKALLRMDSAAAAQFMKSLWEMGALTANEARELDERNKYDGGDDFFVPMNFRRVQDNVGAAA